MAWPISLRQSNDEYFIATAKAPSKVVESSLKEPKASTFSMILVKSLTLFAEGIFWTLPFSGSLIIHL